ncbi:hypothetical protein KKH05_00130 [Patescibacteria group bacterium]|nr:hypothetical protein [Patescibacteria group bacterium]
MEKNKLAIKEEIIKAIQGRNRMEISFKKETTEEWAIRKISPYDIYPREDREKKQHRDVLIGYADDAVNRPAHVFSTYLDNIYAVDVSNNKFDGAEIKRLVGAKGEPNVPRDW